jgi:hypothetical protein
MRGSVWPMPPVSKPSPVTERARPRVDPAALLNWGSATGWLAGEHSVRSGLAHPASRPSAFHRQSSPSTNTHCSVIFVFWWCWG